MARLPTPGQDTGTWGGVLNDFLSVAHNGDGTLKNLFVNVKDFGAKGDGTTDDTAAIQSTIDSVPSAGGSIFFPPGIYKITKGLTAGTTGIKLSFIGAGPTGYAIGLGATGVSTILVPANVVGLTYGPEGTSHYLGSPVIRDLCFRGPGATATATTIGVYLRNVSGFRIEDCTFCDFYTAGTGLKTTGIPPYETSYGHVTGSRFMKNFIGADCTGAGYTSFFQCLFDGENNLLPDTLQAGSIGIKDPMLVSGCELQSYETLIDVASVFNGRSFTDNRYENFAKAVYFHPASLTDYRSVVRGGSWYSKIPNTKGVVLSSNARTVTVDTRSWIQHDDQGDGNTILDPNWGYSFHVPGIDQGRPFKIGYNATNEIHIQFGAGSPEGIRVAPPGSLYLNISGGAGKTLYVKESGTGNTGWVAK